MTYGQRQETGRQLCWKLMERIGEVAAAVPLDHWPPVADAPSAAFVVALTAWELARHGVPSRVIVDGAAAWLIGRRSVAAALVGADRIAANGDAANKIGTLGLALACAHHGVPLYVVAPLSTIDPATPDGDAIPIEERAERELFEVEGIALAAPGTRALNPAFEVTPASLIAAIVTERGMHRPPYRRALAAALAVSQQRSVAPEQRSAAPGERQLLHEG